MRSTWCQCGGAAPLANRLERAERRPRPLDPRQLALDQLRRRALAAVLDALGEIALELVAIGGKALQVGIVGIRLRHEVEEMERAARRGRQVGRDRGDDAASRPGDQEGRLSRELARRGLGRALGEAHGPPQLVRVAHLDRTRVAQRLIEQQLRQRGGLAAGREVDDLDQRLVALAGQRLGEAGDGATHDGRRPRRVVAVAAPEARRRDEEGAGAGDLIGEHPHGGRQQLHTHAQPLAPACGIERGDRPLVVERGQPVDALDRPLGLPLDETALELLGLGLALDLEDLDAELGQPLRERRTDTAPVGHQDHAAAGAKLDPGRHAAIKGRPEDRDRHARA